MHLKLIKPKLKEPMSIEKSLAIIEKAIKYHLHAGYGNDVNCLEHNRDRDAWNFVKLFLSYQVNHKKFKTYLESTDIEDGGDYIE